MLFLESSQREAGFLLSLKKKQKKNKEKKPS